jgi:hypothetical protein
MALKLAIARPGTPRASADMNVSPLIDILLVLLIIVMAALPLTQKGVDVELPELAPRTPPPSPRRARSCSRSMPPARSRSSANRSRVRILAAGCAMSTRDAAIGRTRAAAR